MSADPTTALDLPASRLSPAARRGWSAATALLMWGVFLQSVTAGRILRGDDWAGSTHRSAAGLLFVATVVAAIVALATLRQHPLGRRMATILCGLAVALIVQHRLGAMAADGEDVLWLHVPVGVALVGFALQPNVLARRLT